MDYAKAIRTARSAKGWTQRQLAKAAGLDPSYVSLLEKGARVPRIDRLEDVARALGIPLHLLVLLGATKDELRTVAPNVAEGLARDLLTFFTETPDGT